MPRSSSEARSSGRRGMPRQGRSVRRAGDIAVVGALPVRSAMGPAAPWLAHPAAPDVPTVQDGGGAADRTEIVAAAQSGRRQGRPLLLSLALHAGVLAAVAVAVREPAMPPSPPPVIAVELQLEAPVPAPDPPAESQAAPVSEALPEAAAQAPSEPAPPEAPVAEPPVPDASPATTETPASPPPNWQRPPRSPDHRCRRRRNTGNRRSVRPRRSRFPSRPHRCPRPCLRCRRGRTPQLRARRQVVRRPTISPPSRLVSHGTRSTHGPPSWRTRKDRVASLRHRC